MSSSQRIKIPRVSDKKIAETFQKLGGQYGVEEAHVRAFAFADLGKISIVSDATGDWKALLDHDSTLIDTMSISIKGLTVAYARGGQDQQKSPIYDEITLSWSNGSTPSNVEKINISAFLTSHLIPFEAGRMVGNVVSEEQSHLLAIHQSTLERLERLNEELVRQSIDFRKNLDDKFEEKVTQNESEYTKKKEQLDTDRNALIAQMETKEQALNVKLQAIDDRNNTHARREIRDRMLEDVKQRINQFGVSEATRAKRKPVLFGILSLLFAFLGLLVWTGYEIGTMNSQSFRMLEAIRNISAMGPELFKSAGLSSETIAKIFATDIDRSHIFWLWGRFAIFSFGLVGTVLYYIKWQNRWAEQHIVSEFQLQQFYIDVNRANWVIESCLEWRKETNSEIPDELLGSITSGLFVSNQTELERVIHPADELASALLGSASKLKLKIGDSELEFDKPKKIPNEPIKVGAE